MTRLAVACPLCAVPIELPAQDVAAGGRLTFGTEPLFDHVAEHHGPPVLRWLDLPRQVDVVACPVDVDRQAAVIVEQRELTDTGTCADTT